MTMTETRFAIKWFLRYFKKSTALFSVAIIFFVVSIALDLSIVGIQKFIIDDVFINKKTEHFITILVVFVLIVIFEIIFYTLYEINIEKCKSVIEIAMRQDFMRKLFDISIVKYKQKRIGEVNTRLNEYIRSARFITEILPKIIGTLANIVLLVGAVSFIHPVMILVAGLTSILYYVIARYFSARILQKNADINNARAELNVRFEESIVSTREIVAFNRQKWELGRIKDEYAKLIIRIKSELSLRNKQVICREPINWIVNISTLGYGGYLVITDHITVGSFLVMYQFIDRLIIQFQALYSQFADISGQFAAVEKGSLIIADLDKDKDQSIETVTFSEEIRAIDFKQVTFGYTSDMLLKDLSFSLPVHKKVAFVGPSGCGKSTLLQILSKIYTPSSGEIFINGAPLQEITSASWFNRVSIVFQEPYFYPGTILENLLLGRNIPMEEVVRSTKLALIDDTIQSLPSGYDTMLGEQGVTLSGGQKQRLAIARALLRNPEILILDESTSALDVSTEIQLQRNIDTVRKNQTTILIAHRLSTVENADVIYVMNRGGIVACGTHAELLKGNSFYKSLVFVGTKEENSILV